MQIDMGETDLKLYVLGAGCSSDCGYPLASEFATDLREWANNLDPVAASRLLGCVRDTLSLMGGTIDTVDTLVWKIDRGEFDQSKAVMGEEMMKEHQRRAQRVHAAKLAISALFQSREAAALDTGLKRYREFLSDVFPGAENFWFGKVAETPCAVLSFNYDRLFELAFQDRFRVDAKRWGFYGQKVFKFRLGCGL